MVKSSWYAVGHGRHFFGWYGTWWSQSLVGMVTGGRGRSHFWSSMVLVRELMVKIGHGREFLMMVVRWWSWEFNRLVSCGNGH